jgi:hypothetical protein
VMFSLIFSLMTVSIIITKFNMFKISTFRYWKNYNINFKNLVPEI